MLKITITDVSFGQIQIKPSEILAIKGKGHFNGPNGAKCMLVTSRPNSIGCSETFFFPRETEEEVKARIAKVKQAEGV